MALLVLGSGGRLGKLLRAAWPGDPAVPTLWHGGEGSEFQFNILSDPSALAAAIAQSNTILLLAGVTQEREDWPFSTNVELARTVLEAAGARPVLLASSAAVYGRAGGVLHENILSNPASNYGKSKRDMEHLAGAFPRTTCLRIGNVAGADALLGTARDHYNLDRFSDGTYPMRSYIGPRMLAQVICDLALKADDLPPTLNIACPDLISMADLLDAAAKSWQATIAPDTAIKTVHLDTTRLWAILPKRSGTAAQIVADWQSVITQK